MGKKKYFSIGSMMKLGSTISAITAGRVGGIIGLDREAQRQLIDYGTIKAQYWANRFSAYHSVRELMKSYLVEDEVPKIKWGLAYALAQKVVKIYAMYPERVADTMADAVMTEAEQAGIDGTLAKALPKLRDFGLDLKRYYELQTIKFQ